MLGKSQIFSLTTESGISGILSGKPLKNNLGNRHFELWGKHPKQKKNWEIEEKLGNAIFFKQAAEPRLSGNIKLIRVETNRLNGKPLTFEADR